MNRIEFMDRLTLLLSDLPEEERGEALQYYNDYLDDAGVENEQEVLEALGTPEGLAASIREGLNESGQQGEFSERGFRQQGAAESGELPARKAEGWKQEGRKEDGRDAGREPGGERGDGGRPGAESGAGDFQKRYRSGKKSRSGLSVGAWILIVICGIFAAPILIPVAFALLVVVVVLAATAVVVALAVLLSGVICIAAGIWALFAAAVKLLVAPAGAVLAIGISLMTIGIGILLVLGMGWLMGRFFPTVCRGCVNFCSRIIRRKGGKSA